MGRPFAILLDVVIQTSGVTVKRYDDVILSYRSEAPGRDEEEAWWSDGRLSIADSIRRACLSVVPRGSRKVRHSHQCRWPQDVLEEAANKLVEHEKEVTAAPSFAALLEVVDRVVSPIRGAGELYVYDVAARVGLRLGLEPEEIYLHRGTREGAAALGIRVKGRKTISITELPEPLQVLSAAEAEDVLCIYKSQFNGNVKGRRETVCGRTTQHRPRPAGRCAS